MARHGGSPVRVAEVTAPMAGRMDMKGIVRWMQRRAGPSTTLLQDTSTASTFISSQDLVVVGFFKVGWGG